MISENRSSLATTTGEIAWNTLSMAFLEFSLVSSASLTVWSTSVRLGVLPHEAEMPGCDLAVLMQLLVSGKCL